MPNALVYGANGYTGRLVVEECLRRGLRPVLSGRSVEVAELARAHQLDARLAALDDPIHLLEALSGITVVLHCAGPFSRTSKPMADACLAAGVHYLDITGEISVFETLAARNNEAKARGVMLLPGIGFDVVPSDCLAAQLKRKLPGAVRLRLAFQSTGGMSRGTATTMVENVGKGGAIRRDGRIVPVPVGWKTIEVDLGRGPTTVTTIPWGDVATAWYSTGIPDIEVYTRTTPGLRAMLKASRFLGPLLRTQPIQRRLKAWVRNRGAGPDESARARGRCSIWGEVADASGRTATGRLTGPEGYTMTARTSVLAVEQVLRGVVTPGFQTPSLAFGPEFVEGVEGVEVVVGG